MNKPTTHVLMIVDDSGSMYYLANDVRGGFNSYVEGLQQDTEQHYHLTVAKFGSGYELMARNAEPESVARLDNRNYTASQGGTALYDAIGKLITSFENDNIDMPATDRVLLVVQTDGEDNASVEFTMSQVRKMIDHRESCQGWTCLFLAAGPDAWKQGSGLGFASNKVFQTQATAKGTETVYRAVTETSRAYSRGASQEAVAETMRGGLADEN